ncbi:MAG: phosphatidylinositol transfer protein [Minicystis sp.]
MRLTTFTALALASAALVACGPGTGEITGGTGAGSSTSSASTGGNGGSGGESSSSTSSSSGTGGAGGVPGAWCAPIPACDTAPPDPGPAQPWTHDIASPIIVATGDPNHRGRDLYLNPGDPQWIIAKFAYGLADKDLKDEKVDIYLLRDCGSAWEKLGTAVTTQEDAHASVEGVDDSGGRVYFQIPPDKALAPGRHRAHLVVQGDLSSTDVFIEVVPPHAPMFVTDVDGTLTDSENAEFGALLTGSLPGVHPDAAKAFGILVSKGYHPMYVTARPEWLVQRTRELLDTNAFPPGVVHTTLGLTGATGSAAATYKTDEMALLATKGLLPAWAFGNTATDAEAYENGMIMPVDHRIFYQFDDTMFGGRRIESYTDLLAEVSALPSLCP